MNNKMANDEPNEKSNEQEVFESVEANIELGRSFKDNDEQHSENYFLADDLRNGS